MFITQEELKTHLYAENVRLIQGEDTTILTAAIDSAIAEAKGYLAHYDRRVLFEAKGAKRNALLLTFVKDIAVWHFIVLCNAGADLEFRRFRYERAIAWLRAVQKGEVVPDFPPLDEDLDGKPDPPGEYIFGSNPKRHQHF